MQTESRTILLATIKSLQQNGGHFPSLLEGVAVPAYEVFFGQCGTATVEWRGRVDGLGCAYERMKELARQEPGAYFVFCSRTRRVLAYIDTTIPKRNDGRNCA